MASTIPGARCITEDSNHYYRSVGIYDRRAVTQTFNCIWLQRTFPEEIVAKLRHNFPDTKELHILNVGSGSGEIDCTMLKHLRAKFESVNNRVVEPSAEMLAEYKSRVKDLAVSKQLTDVACDWHQQGLEEYMESSAGLEGGKFHLISAMHSLYYVLSQEPAVDYLYDKLEEGGLLIVVMQDDNCGYLKIHRRFPLYDGAKGLLAALPNICKRLKERNIQYDQQLLPATYDITSCYQGTEEGSYIVDFLSHVMNFEQAAPDNLKNDFLKYVKSTECASMNGNQVLLNADETALIIERKTSSN